MADFQGGDILACETIFPHYQFWLNYYILRNEIYLPRFLQWKTTIYRYSYWRKISIRKFDSRLHLVTHALHLGPDKYPLTWKRSFPTYLSSPRDASITNSSGSGYITWWITLVPSLEYSWDDCRVMDNF